MPAVIKKLSKTNYIWNPDITLLNVAAASYPRPDSDSDVRTAQASGSRRAAGTGSLNQLTRTPGGKSQVPVQVPSNEWARPRPTLNDRHSGLDSEADSESARA